MNDPPISLGQKLVYLLLVGVAHSVAINAFNLLAGFNGLECGVTVISSIALSIYYYAIGHEYVAAVLILLAVGYGVIWRLNRYPARIFLGDSGTLIPASIYIGLSVYTGQWLPLLFVMGPHLLNALVKLLSTGISSRSDHQPLVYKDGMLHLPEKNYWSVIRLYLQLAGPKTEQQIVYFVYAVEAVFCLMMFVVLLLKGGVR
ncbi:MAG: hypothetical protein KAV87_43435 [Desulfobacteraceae bacterium]|nr:hypothetical protein [Desulfobacteraceae bacterium]